MAMYSFGVASTPSGPGYQSTEVSNLNVITPTGTLDTFIGASFTTYTYGVTWSLLLYGWIAFEGDITAQLTGTTANEILDRWNGSAWEYFQTNTVYPTVFYNSTYNVTVIQCPTANTMWVEGYAPPTITQWTRENVTVTDFAQAARAYFDTPAVPYMDIDIYTNEKTVTVKWDNITNLPAGLYPASYYMKFSTRDSLGGWNYLSSLPYTTKLPDGDKGFSFSFNDALDCMPAPHRQQALADQAFMLRVDFGTIDNDLDFPYIDVVNGAIFTVDMSDGTITTDNPGDGNTTDDHPNTSIYINGTFPDDNSSGDTETAGLDLSVDNLLTSSYVITEANLQSFGAYVWQNNLQGSLYENQVAPLENVLACKRFPFSISASATATNVYLGNVDTGVSANRVNDGHKVNVGSLTIPTVNNNFLDLQNNISIYLPYCGIHSIPAASCYKQAKDLNGIPFIQGRTLSVDYYYDVVFGSCIAKLSLDGIFFAAFNGNCGVDIPITASNRASTELSIKRSEANMAVGMTASSAQTLLNGGVAMGTALLGGGDLKGAAVGVGTSLAGQIINNAAAIAKQDILEHTQERHYTTSGGFSSQVASYLTPTVLLIIDAPVYGVPDGYAHENGFPCNIAYNMKDLTGYTELDGAIEISGISCLEKERDLLKEALTSGFYL